MGWFGRNTWQEIGDLVERLKSGRIPFADARKRDLVRLRVLWDEVEALLKESKK